ncbi:MAG: MOSC N-terminal beta barrel domain-containing protein [Gammaproteobacteria bacterium]|nr:MOSC N-terminal beta barrel domain-containing protein [Gammaproteobacteria bacterium]
MTHVSDIVVYPIKSLDGHAVESSQLRPGGALAWDREFAMVDADGVFINSKRTGDVSLLRAQYRLPETGQATVSLGVAGFDERDEFDLDVTNRVLAEWLSDFFGFAVTLIQNRSGGFPDDTGCNGPTIVSTQSLQAVAGWYSDIDVDSVRRRIRANIEVSAPEAFWEDRCFGDSETPVSIVIAHTTLLGVRPCERCIVPSRDPESGEVDPNFERTFRRMREHTLPHWAARSQFDSFYKLTVNTKVGDSENGKSIRRGDDVVVAS